MIWLFSNLGYGLPFLKAAGRFARQHDGGIRAVLSTREEPLVALGPILRLRQHVAAFVRRRRLMRELGLPLIETTNVNENRFLRRIRPADAGIIAGFNQIFRPGAIDRFSSIVNFHPSVLPLYRGPVPSYWCLKNGEERTGFTLHRVTEKIDEGEILFQQALTIGQIHDPNDLDRAIAQQAVPVLLQYLEHLRTGRAWKQVRIDGHEVYRHHIGYASFPLRQEPQS